jgi:hypothetical protein
MQSMVKCHKLQAGEEYDKNFYKKVFITLELYFYIRTLGKKTVVLFCHSRLHINRIKKVSQLYLSASSKKCHTFSISI